MSTFKEYARRARERMKNGFWESAKQRLQQEREVAATTGVNQAKLSEEHRRRIESRFTTTTAFARNRNFTAKWWKY